MICDRDKQLAQFLLNKQIVSAEAIQECWQVLQRCRQNQESKDLATILLARGYVSQEKMAPIFANLEQGSQDRDFPSTVMSDNIDPVTKPVLNANQQRPTAQHQFENIDAIKNQVLAGNQSHSTAQRQFGRYQIIQEIGRGGMGVVYKAHDPELERTVALKVLLAPEKFLDRFAREAKATASLRHPNIVSVYDIGRTGQQHFFTMDFIDGISLKKLYQLAPLSIEQIVAVLSKVARAVDYANEQGIIHRDLKPSNIMIDGNKQPKVMDFGLAKMEKASKRLSQTGMMIGTLEYMSPEQAQGNPRHIDKRSDVYGLGAILYELLTGIPPFTGNSSYEVIYKIANKKPAPPRQTNRNIPKDLETICLKALAKNMQARYQSAKEFAEDLERFARSEPIRGCRQTPWSSIAVLAKRHRHWLAAMVIVLVVLGISYKWVDSKRQAWHQRVVFWCSQAEGLRQHGDECIKAAEKDGQTLKIARRNAMESYSQAALAWEKALELSDNNSKIKSKLYQLQKNYRHRRFPMSKLFIEQTGFSPLRETGR